MSLFSFDNSYARLPDRFYARLEPTPVPEPKLLIRNEELARRLGVDLDGLSTDHGVAALAGNRVPAGAEPLAQAYAGHQFGNFVPQLGDGRALLLGEVVDEGGHRWDVQLKGSGPTPYSRRGDGRAVIGPVLREYLVSEAMYALGVPTTRALAAVSTGQGVMREGVLPGAILTRVASSHIRVGTFQFFAVRGDTDAVRALLDFAIDRHYPQVRDAEDPALAFVRAVMERQARLVAHWMSVGFIHGVMNTDNTSVSGETIDYGPCAFMDHFDSTTVFSSIDRNGRYAYGAQPRVIGWNMARLAETLIPLIAGDEKAAIAKAQALVEEFPAMMEAAWLSAMIRKLGLDQVREGDRQLVLELLYVMQAARADFTNTFRALCDAASGEFVEELAGDDRFEQWLAKWRARLRSEPSSPEQIRTSMRAVNPAFIPRNHRVEVALAAAAAGDLFELERMHAILARPFDDQPEHDEYRKPPRPEERVRATFCGT